MTIFEIIILAIIQGITEFLPISSSAHLILPEVLLGWEAQGIAFDVAVHLGSLLAVMIYFRQDIINMTIDWVTKGFTRQQTPNSRLAWWVIVATIPAIAIGAVFKNVIEVYLRTGEVIALTTIVFGLLLWYADKKASLQREVEQIGFKHAVYIGLSQALALIPGTSRSGITMTTGLLLGYTREAAARFSFLLSIPVILGAGLLATLDLLDEPYLVDWAALGYGVVFSFVSAYACISLFLTWINRIGMTPFVVYRLLLGAILIIVLI
jgi:undecaprenyl-diphosphatase